MDTDKYASFSSAGHGLHILTGSLDTGLFLDQYQDLTMGISDQVGPGT